MTIRALIDSGASLTFINPKIITPSARDKINRFVSGRDNQLLQMKKRKLRLNSAFDTAYMNCTLSMNGWKGVNEFSFVDINEDAILGLDFFKKFNDTFKKFNTINIRENGKEVNINMIDIAASDPEAEKLTESDVKERTSILHYSIDTAD